MIWIYSVFSGTSVPLFHVNMVTVILETTQHKLMLISRKITKLSSKSGLSKEVDQIKQLINQGITT